MALSITVQNISITTAVPSISGVTSFTGEVQLLIIPTGATKFGQTSMTIPFSNCATLRQGVQTALGGLKDYADDLIKAATEASVLYKT